jgi:hypothetical protein
MKAFRRILVASLVMIMVVQTAVAQSGSDPAMQKAREETLVIFDLGRMFGYLNVLEKDTKVPALSNAQLTKLYDIMVELRSTRRVEVARARTLLATIEDSILTPAQLMAADKLSATREPEKATNQGSGAGAGSSSSSGAGSLASYVSGGDFNPVLDTTKTMGQDFSAFFEYTARKLGRK